MKRYKTILAGGGGHALSLLEALPPEIEAIGYTAPVQSPAMPLKWLGDDTQALKEAGDAAMHVAFVYSGLPTMARRRAIINELERSGAAFRTIVAPTSVVTPNATLGDGCAVLHRAVVNRAFLDRHVIVNTGAIVEHDCHIGRNTFIGPGAVIGGGVTIGEDCFIGLGARVKNGVTIAPGVTVGMGCTVNDNLDRPGIYHGNPLKYHKLKD